jgi:cobalt-zinc-cadmium efflux system protein
MVGAPPGLDVDEVTRAVCALDGVEGMHHLHAWQIDEQHIAMEAHVVVLDEMPSDRREDVRHAVKQLLLQRFGIGHSTLELEAANAGRCDDENAGCGAVPQ